jgi:hypothetical protein
LLQSTKGSFHVDDDNIIHIGTRKGWNKGSRLGDSQGSRLGDTQDGGLGEHKYWSWDFMADRQALYLRKEQLHRSWGSVFLILPKTPVKAGRELETLEDRPEDINDDIEMVDKRVWAHIRYTAIDNSSGGTGSTEVKAFVGGKDVFFYSGPHGELKVLQKDSRVSDPHMNGFEQLN